jgi:hypothetical protein
MSSTTQKLSIVAGLLAAAIGTTAEAGIINVGTGTTFSYSQPTIAGILSSTDTNYNLTIDGNCVRVINWKNAGDITSYMAWHFQTGSTGNTFVSGLKMTQVLQLNSRTNFAAK